MTRSATNQLNKFKRDSKQKRKYFIFHNISVEKSFISLNFSFDISDRYNPMALKMYFTVGIVLNQWLLVQSVLNVKMNKITTAKNVPLHVCNAVQFLKIIKIAAISLSLIDFFIGNTLSAMAVVMKLY